MQLPEFELIWTIWFQPAQSFYFFFSRWNESKPVPKSETWMIPHDELAGHTVAKTVLRRDDKTTPVYISQ